MSLDVQVACVIGVALALLFLVVMAARRAPPNPNSARLDRIDLRMSVVEKALSETQHDLSGVRMVVQNLPNKDAIHRMEIELTAATGKVGALASEVTSATRAVERVEDLLLKRIGSP